jgi:DNA-binding beta-propeller fold protein YncE
MDGCSYAQPGFFGGIAVDENGDLLLTDTSLHAVLIIERDGRAFVLAGGNGPGFSDGWGRNASFDKPRGLAVDGSGRVFVADSNNNAVRVLLTNGKIETITGEDLGIEGGLSHPAGVAIGRDGYLCVSDQFNNCMYRVLV